MAPDKRSFDTIDATEASSSAKRIRLSDAALSIDHDHSRDSVSEDEDSLDDNEIALGTQALRDRYESLGGNHAVDNGIIERVDCYNFMCHEHLRLDLGPLINFIVGKNGSGKSAALTALTICLGVKASATNRGQSLRKFVKEGKDSATIVVRIKNRGDTAYLPDTYGPSIIVERTFSKSGSSAYKIRNSNNRVVSEKKADLASITDYFTLQIDNPMNVLSQDMARQFLSSSGPSEKYKFFVKGVQLEQLDQDYQLVEETLERSMPHIDQLTAELTNLKAKKDETRARLEASDRQEGLRARLRNLRGQMAWAQVEEQERIRDSFDQELTTATRRLTDLKNEVEKTSRLYDEANRDFEAAQGLVREAKSDCDRLREDAADLKSSFDSKEKARQKSKADQLAIRDNLKKINTNKKDTQDNIEQEVKRLEEINGGSRVRLMDELASKEAAAKDASVRLADHRNHTCYLREEISKAEAQAASDDRKFRGQRSEVETAERHLAKLVTSLKSQASAYPEDMARLQQAIEKERSFSQKPVGPLGKYVTLLKPQWSSILEKSMGSNLSGFVVTSKSDMNILSGIMQRLRCNYPILIGNDARPMDTSAFEPESKFDTALRIDNDLVRRQLVINHSIEQVLLIEDLREATEVMYGGPAPKNVKRCYCLDDRDRRRGIYLGFTRTGGQHQSPLDAYTGQSRMKTDIEVQIRFQREAIDTLKRVLVDAEQQKISSINHLEKCKQALVKHQKQELKLQVDVQKAEDVVEQLKETIEKESIEDGHLEALKTALGELENDERYWLSSYEDSVGPMDTLRQELRDIKREQAAKDAEISAAEERVKKLEDEETRVSLKRNNALGEKNASIRKVTETENDILETERKRDEVGQRILTYNEEASKISVRVSVDAGETTQSLDKKLNKLSEDMERYDRQIGATRQEIAEAAAEADEKYERSKKEVDLETQLLKQILKTINERRERWITFRSNISARAKLQFSYLLSERSYRGSILINHKRKLLDLTVEPDSTRDSTGRRAKTLSGGEKSFSQICLLLSLWEAMGSPIRCLDEFDVYMDSVNRKISIELLMTAARRSVGRQFILITPGSRAEIKPAPDVSIIELAEPERGQGTLSFNR